MFDPKLFTKEQLIKDAVKGLIDAVREGNDIQYADSGFIVTLYPQRNPFFEVRLFLDGRAPCVTRCSKHLSKEVM